MTKKFKSLFDQFSETNQRYEMRRYELARDIAHTFRITSKDALLELERLERQRHLQKVNRDRIKKAKP